MIFGGKIHFYNELTPVSSSGFQIVVFFVFFLLKYIYLERAYLDLCFTSRDTRRWPDSFHVAVNSVAIYFIIINLVPLNKQCS